VITLVLLPGMDGSGALFAPLVAALGDTVRTEIISYPPDQLLGYEELVAFVRARLPTVPYFLLGESFSGPVAIALAASEGPGLRGLILSCTYARNPSPSLKPFRFLLPWIPLSARLSFSSAPLLLGRHATRQMVRALREALAPVSAQVLRHRLNAVLDVDCSAPTQRVGMPVLYLQATRDRVVSAASARHLECLLPGMQRVRITGPHLLLQVAPTESAQAIVDFVKAWAVEDQPGL
jgi:pimeloyl-[acyl-carrier protein] methyl ester esterase